MKTAIKVLLTIVVFLAMVFLHGLIGSSDNRGISVGKLFVTILGVIGILIIWIKRK